MALPESRDITINTGDPIPPNLLNKLQDLHSGGKRTHTPEKFFPGIWVGDAGGSAVCVQNPIGGSPPAVALAWKLQTVDFGLRYATQIPFTPGDQVTGFSFDLYGDGALTVNAQLVYYPDLNSAGGAASTSSIITAAAASWNTVTLAAVGVPGGLQPSTSLILVISAGNVGFIHVGSLTPTFARL